MSSGKWSDAPAGLKAGLIGRRLVRLRGNRKQQDIAAAAGMDQTQLSRYENGKALPTDEVISRLADALGCSIEDILEPLTFQEGKEFLSGLAPAKRAALGFGNNVVSRLNGMTASEISKKTKIPTSLIDKIFKGEVTPSKWLVDKFSNLLKCLPEDLWADYAAGDKFIEGLSTSTDFKDLDLKGEVWEAFDIYTGALKKKIFSLVHRQVELLDEITLLKIENAELRNKLSKIS